MNSPRYKTFGFAVVMLVMTLAAAAYSASPVTSDVIHGCVNARTRQLRVVSGPGQCIQNEFALSWNKTGPQGPQGDTGPQGPEGPQGPQGPEGSSPYTFEVVKTFDEVFCFSPPCQKTLMADCPTDFFRVSVVDCLWSTGALDVEFVAPPNDKSKLGCKFNINSSDVLQVETKILCVKGVPLPQ